MGRTTVQSANGRPRHSECRYLGSNPSSTTKYVSIHFCWCRLRLMTIKCGNTKGMYTSRGYEACGRDTGIQPERATDNQPATRSTVV